MKMNTDNNLQLSETSLGYLNTTRKWTLFFAILGFIGTGFLFISGMGMILMGIFMENIAKHHFPFSIMGIFYLILGAVLIIPTWYLLKFSNSAKRLCTYREQNNIDTTFLHLKSYYKFMGITTIVIFSVYIIAILAFIVSYAFLH